jgi:WhiB family transcriptional regulator, redox-sensing transcriptional regulator
MRLHLMKAPTASDDSTGRGQDWIEQAACRDADPEVFADPTDGDELAQALATCARCPVARTCLDTALAHDQIGDISIWGGTTVAVRDQIRAGTLTRDDALHLQTGPYRHDRDRTPMVAVTTDEHGDFTDSTGRVLITRLPAGDYITLVDRRPIARTPTLTDACQAARLEQRLEPVPRPSARPPSPDLLQVHVDEHGDYVDDSGRILITRVPTEPSYLVFVDNRFHSRAETLNCARAAAHASLQNRADARDLVTASRTAVAATNDSRHRPGGQPREHIRTAAVRRSRPDVSGSAPTRPPLTGP